MTDDFRVIFVLLNSTILCPQFLSYEYLIVYSI